MKAVVRPAQTRPPLLSFFNLVELYVLAAMRRRHKVSMPKVRGALDYVKRESGHLRPLLEQDFLTNGVDLFVERYSSASIHG